MLYLENIIPIYFIVSLAIGILIVYLYQPKPKIIYKYPTPDKAKDITYQDKTHTCFKYKTSKVNCPLNKNKILNIEK